MSSGNGKDPHPGGEPMISDLAAEFERGLRFAHILLEETQDEEIKVLARINALADVLIQKGILTPEELDAALTEYKKRVEEMARPRVRLHQVQDKYADPHVMDVDCAALIPICQARCCTFSFWLSSQDLDEGIARWDYGNPYWIRQDADGYCTHFDRSTRGCTIHPKRPHICRMYDCRKDKRIWADFENKILAEWTPTHGNADVALEEMVNFTAIKAAEKKAASG